VASLGEFEQGLPIIERLRSEYPSHKMLVTFFSPSGYEVKKNTLASDVVCYLPMDTRKNAFRFLDTVRPELAIFVKYEIWPNYLRELEKRKIPAILISAIFKRNQIYFKWYGGFMRKALGKFDHYFVQDETSQKRLASIQIKNSSVSGDTRLDRVSEILDRDNQLDFMPAFKKDRLCFVAGSTWLEDESVLIDYINNTPKNLKYILAPHTIKKDKILGLAGAITKKKVLYSNIGEKDVGDCDVLIVDTIGLLTKIYSYADIAYVGGGFATGLHNTLEPAVFGVPVIIGPHYEGFKEAEDLVAQKGILPVKDQWSFDELMKKLLDNPEFRKKTGAINAGYIAKNKGASTQIMAYIRTLL
jgi:3-deoxy-D-manno-octulosonic-acid transferase